MSDKDSEQLILPTLSNRWLRIEYTARQQDIVFNNLLSHINVETMREAYRALDGSKALGTDGVSKIVYGESLEANLQNLISRIHRGSYKPQPKREVMIPKANGKMRPIAISCFEDKLVEWVIGKILTSAYEPIFIKNSFGFRENRSAHQAIRASYSSLKDNRRPHVVEIDFANFFNSISHKKLMKILSKRVSDRRFKGLIGRFLKIGIVGVAATLTQSEVGTAQGSVMSPVLANIFLHDVLDQWFMRNYASSNDIIVRYADDAVFFFKSKERAICFLRDLENQIRGYGLELNEEKTRIIDFGRGNGSAFDFLGFTFYWARKRRGKESLKVKTQQKALHRKIQEFYHWIKSVRSKLKLSEIWSLAKSKLIGHYTYYGFADNRHKLNHFYYEALGSMFKWLNRRSQIRSYSWEQFEKRLKSNPLPSPPPMAQLIHLEWRWAYA